MSKTILELKNFDDFSEYLNMEPKKLGYMLYKMRRDKLYYSFSIEKKSGGKREISSPVLQLKKLLYIIKLGLEDIYKPNQVAHGFIKERSIVTNAKKHIGKAWIVNIDLEDFFTSITVQRVYGLFRAKPFSLEKSIASYFANILTFNDVLPQGSPTSPIITNMICFKMDRMINEYCKRNGVVYTRYADDLTFSSDMYSNFDKIYDFERDSISERLESIIEKNDFKVNVLKTRYSFHHQHQEVTGLKVNKKTNISSFQKYRIRAMLHAWDKYGLRKSTEHYMKKRDIVGEYKGYIKTYKNELRGLIAYAKMVLSSNNDFYYNSAFKFNELSKETYFHLHHSEEAIYDNATFSLNRFDKDGLIESQSVAFYAEGYFYTCLHNVYNKDGFELLEELSKSGNHVLNSFLEKQLKHSEIINQIFDEDNPVKLNKINIRYVSTAKDLIIFKVKDFYSQYEFKINRDKIDRRKKYSLVAMDFSTYMNHLKKCKLSKRKTIGGAQGHSLDTSVYLGMSGSPVVLEATNEVYGYVVYGSDENPSEEDTFKNGMYLFDDESKV